MSPVAGKPSRQEVLDAFAVEPDTGRATLERYLGDYPELATELLDLSRLLATPFTGEESPLTSEDEAKVNAAWLRHAAARPAAVTDPFSALSVHELRDIAHRLSVPRQVLMAFRNRRIIMSTVPRPFLARLADLVSTAPEQLLRALSLPASFDSAHSYRSDRKPVASDAVSFEQTLIEAGVPQETRAELLSEAG